MMRSPAERNRKPDARIDRSWEIIRAKEKIRNSSDFLKTGLHMTRRVVLTRAFRGPGLTMSRRDERGRHKTPLGARVARSPHTASDCRGMGIVHEGESEAEERRERER